MKIPLSCHMIRAVWVISYHLLSKHLVKIKYLRNISLRYLKASIISTILTQTNKFKPLDFYLHYLNLYYLNNNYDSNKPIKSKNNNNKKAKPTKTNSKVTGIENVRKTTTETTKTAITTTLNDPGMVRKGTGTCSSTMRYMAQLNIWRWIACLFVAF